MTIKLEVGKRYELNNGEVHECTKMHGDDPLAVDHLGFGPFVISGILYHQDGRRADYDAECDLSVKRCVDGAPKLWRDMTPEEKGALLLAHHEGKTIELFLSKDDWMECSPYWSDDVAYRVKPGPVRETVTLRNFHEKAKGFVITFNVIDGVPDCDSIKMEELP